MRNWDQSINSPIQLTLAADSRFCVPDPFNDQIWDFNLAKSEPPAATLQTTYGLRAQTMQVFPRFIFNDKAYVNPFEFHEKSKIQTIFTNYLSLSLFPVEDIKIIAEYWVVDSQSIAGRFSIHNLGKKVSTLQFNLASILKPLGEGDNMNPIQMGTSAYLHGKTNDISPVCVLAGDTQIDQSPFPSLTQCVQVVPGKTKTIQWALVSLKAAEESLNHAKEILEMNWDSEIAKIFMVNEAQWVDISTGDITWDFALADAQRQAYALIMAGQPANPTFVLSRRSDMGYSFADDGKTLLPNWKKQTALDAFHLMGFLLPGGTQILRQILDGFLAKYESATDTSVSDTETDVQPLEKTRLDQPFLCSMAWEFYRHTKDEEWLAENINKLTAYLKMWFDGEHDHDNDGFPEWEDVFQSGLEESPAFNRWSPETQGLNIQSVESPALVALLYQECKCLINLAQAVHSNENIPWISERIKNLQRLVEECWNEKSGVFCYRDYQSHISQTGKNIFTSSGNGQFQINKTFTKGMRLLLHLVGKEETRRKLKIVIYGKNKKEEIQEIIQFFDISWLHGQAYYTSANLYTKIVKTEIEGLNDDDEVIMFCADHQLQDITQLIPLYSHIASAGHATKLTEKSIAKDYWGKYGLPISPQNVNALFLAKPAKTSILWNSLIGYGLLKYKKQKLAYSLISNIMRAVTKNHQKYWGFHQYHHHQTAEPSGEMNHLHGFAPVSLFLHTLGVKYIQDDHIIIRGLNPFPWPVTVKFKGTSVTRHEKDTVIAFFSGQTITVSGPEPQEIRLSNNNISNE